jgi:hypothetical protein
VVERERERERERECVCVCDSTVGYIPVPPGVRTQFIHMYQHQGNLWIYSGVEHWINRAVLLVVVVVVVYDGKPPLRGRWVSLSILIYRFEVYRVSADSEASDSICGEATGLYRSSSIVRSMLR